MLFLESFKLLTDFDLSLVLNEFQTAFFSWLTLANSIVVDKLILLDGFDRSARYIHLVPCTLLYSLLEQFKG